MKKLIGVLVICIFIITSYSQALYAQTKGKIAIYKHTQWDKYDGNVGTWSDSINGFTNFCSRNGYDCKQLSPDDIRNNKLVSDNYDAIFVPGGDTYAMCQGLRSEGCKKIQDFVKIKGGGYIGVCAGSELATEYFHWEGKEEYNNKTKYGCKFYSSLILNRGESHGPLESIKNQEINIDVEDQVENYGTMEMKYYNGSYFVGSGKVILTYNDSRCGKDNGKVAGIRLDVDNGRAVLIGPHPEVSNNNNVNGWFKAQVDWALKNKIGKQQERVQMADKKKTNTRTSSSRGLDIDNLISSLLNR